MHFLHNRMRKQHWLGNVQASYDSQRSGTTVP